MTPQPRGLIPPEHQALLLRAGAAKKLADEQLRIAVVEAIAAGGSVREVAALAGLSTNTVFRWKRAAEA